MPHETEAEQLAPLLNPTYWENLQPGIDLAPDVPTPPRYGRMTQKPGNVLGQYVSKMHTYFAHNTYMPGDPFDACQQPDGTIITYFQESLTTTAESADAMRQEYPATAHEAPKVPFDELKPISRYTHRLSAGDTRYTFGQRWGVVTTHKKTGAKTILSLQACDIEFDSKKVYAGVDLSPLAVRFIVGKTFAYDGKPEAPLGREDFVRIKRLHIAGYHEEDASGGAGKKLRKLASLLIPNPAANPSLGSN